MKKTLFIIGGIFLICIVAIGYKLSKSLNEVDESFHHLGNKRLIIMKSEVSPNEKFQFFEYQFDNGGLGYSRVFWSVIKNDVTIKELQHGLLPDGYRAVGWTEKNELIVEKWEPYYYKSEDINLKSGSIFNKVKLHLKD